MSASGFFFLFNTSLTTADENLDVAQEDQIRAAVVIGIVRYTRWEKMDGTSLTICLIGKNRSFHHLESLNNNITISKKLLNVVRVPTVNSGVNIQKCQVLVVGSKVSGSKVSGSKVSGSKASDSKVSGSKASDSKNALVIDDANLSESYLVICDDCTTEKSSSVILRKDRRRIRFEVDLHNAKLHGVEFSSAMLELAAKVKEVRNGRTP